MRTTYETAAGRSARQGAAGFLAGVAAAGLLGGVLACAADDQESPPAEPPPEAAVAAIDGTDLDAHIRTLSSDEFEGRAPSSEGEERTVAYLREAFQDLGLEPGGPDGSWFQEVPLVAITASPAPLRLTGGEGGPIELAYATEYMGWTKRVVEEVSLEDSPLVFAGYGVVAPEYGWDDYESLDVEGKTVVLLVNDPGFATGDTALFNGRAMTYYGRWTYKYEEAARQGAAGALIVHEDEAAGYPWEVVSGSWSGPQFDLVAEDRNMGRVRVEGWLTLASARRAFEAAGLDYDSLKGRAVEPDFEAVPMPLEASVTLRNALRETTSRNVLARLPGAERPEEHVVYMAHWDHLGRDEESGEIYNGAKDNATGTGGLLEIAQAFAAAEPGPARSVLFLATTAEEQGLLGSKHYAENPVYPLESTVAAINMDGLNIWGPMRDVTVIGQGMSELEEYLAGAAGTQDRSLRPDPEAEKGFYYRSDHFEFAKVGVPALYTDEGVEHVEHGEEWTRARKDEYTAERYHKPADEYDPSWDLTGAVDDLRLLFRVGWALADGDDWPSWYEGTEFRAAREAMRGSAP